MKKLPVLYVYRRAVFPGCTGELPVARRFGSARGDEILVCPVGSVFGRFFALKRLATLCEISGVRELDDREFFELKGLCRVRLHSRLGQGESAYSPVAQKPDFRCDDLCRKLRRRTQEFVFLVDTSESEKLIYLMNFINDPSALCDFVAHYFVFNYEKKMRVYREADVVKRLILEIAIIEQLIAEVNKRKN